MELRWGRQPPQSLRNHCPGPLWLWLMLGLILIPLLSWGFDRSLLNLQHADIQLPSRWSCWQPSVRGAMAASTTGLAMPADALLRGHRLPLPVQWLSMSAVSPTGSILPTWPPPAPSGLSTASSRDWQADLRHLLRRPATVKARVRRPLPELDEITDLLDTVLPHFDLDPDAIPSALRRNVSQRIYTYVGRHHQLIQATLLRADRYLPMIKRVLLARGLPTYYAYLPLVESAFRPDVQHPVSGARGLWQLMGPTAQMCGLEVSQQRDERLNPERATEAAAVYIQTLRKRFGADVPLHVLAAYNFGETHLARGMQQAQTDDIWALYRHHLIPSETREYLLRMIAMWVIVAQPGRFQLLLADAADIPPLERQYESAEAAWLHLTQFVPRPGE